MADAYAGGGMYRCVTHTPRESWNVCIREERPRKLPSLHRRTAFKLLPLRKPSPYRKIAISPWEWVEVGVNLVLRDDLV